MESLRQEFEKDPVKWDIEKCVEIGNNIGMDRQQVSKWNWDHRKKYGFDTSRRNGQLTKSRPPGAKKREVKIINKLYDEHGNEIKRGRGRPRKIQLPQ
jgi:hypothetical protein